MVGNIILGTSETTIYQAGVGTSFAMLSLIFCNTTSSDKTITVYLYANGGSPSNGNTIIRNLVIPAYDTFVWDANEKIIMASQDKISGIADAGSSITVTYNGMTI